MSLVILRPRRNRHALFQTMDVLWRNSKANKNNIGDESMDILVLTSKVVSKVSTPENEINSTQLTITWRSPRATILCNTLQVGSRIFVQAKG